MQHATMNLTHAWPDGQVMRIANAPEYIRRLETENGSLPFLSLPFAEELTERMERMAGYFKRFKHMLVLGIGGSALGSRALQKVFFPQQDGPGHQGPWLWIMDNLDPQLFAAWLDKLPARETLVVVISKSGETVETIAQYFLIVPWLREKLGQSWPEHVLAITDADKGFLRQQAENNGFQTLPVPRDLGGRYSVLSAVGLVPAMFLGLDWKGLLKGAIDLGRPLAADPGLLPDHPAWRMAGWAVNLMRRQLNQLIFFSYIPSLASFGDWFAQLWAESLGKNGKGSMPIPAVGVTDQHSLLQMFLDGPRDKACLFLSSIPSSPRKFPDDLPRQWAWLAGRGLGDILAAETVATKMSLVQAGLPLLELCLPPPDEYAVGKLILLLEAATVFSGWLLDINPLDQPAVEEGKRLAKAGLGAPHSEPEQARLDVFVKQPPLEMKF